MKTIILQLSFFGLLFANTVNAQEAMDVQEKYTSHNKGKFFVAWGGNRDSYTKSDVTFKGKDYNFTIDNMTAHDKPKGWHVDYINPARMTIPQTNFRLGYFLNDHYSVSIGVDHMKYVMTQDQTASVTGEINLPTTDIGSAYNGVYNNTPVNFSDQTFLAYEHTDGLNYVHVEVSRFDDISNLFSIGNTDKIQINLTEGVAFGLLYPKTNTTLLGKERHDAFHVSGYGTSVKAGLNITFLKHFYVQTELKGGYINMPDIRTTISADDTASQHFLFLQRIILFGGIFKI
ncbi:autotransporter domain-containing protein [Flavobacterium algicola]|uniref:autotransporter domain-containing protein n=1 Tax=Flavobacterium algicola TaxID=556529 RepID=UPI001EFDF8C7|nr:autotransporter domain-containing protein [Flavobacterium algicola]MCG9793608.1 autotransporter domain-containing protein [Flavobacterium algicola]